MMAVGFEGQPESLSFIDLWLLLCVYGAPVPPTCGLPRPHKLPPPTTPSSPHPYYFFNRQTVGIDAFQFLTNRSKHVLTWSLWIFTSYNNTNTLGNLHIMYVR